VNCIQAQAMLAAYRELRESKADMAELEVHLEECASCRQALAHYSLIGEQVRSLPAIAPPPDAHAKLMNALAAEHIRYMQRSAPGTYSTPEFLKPYVKNKHSTSVQQIRS
jgi:predicted anti-sigma-YlaC factor YlaD